MSVYHIHYRGKQHYYNTTEFLILAQLNISNGTGGGVEKIAKFDSTIFILMIAS